MTKAVFVKDPDERLDFDFDFYRWLPAGDSIVSATVTFGDDLTAVADQIDVASTQVKVWIMGGTAGETDTLTVRATTDQGRIKEYCAKMKIRNC